MHGRQGVPGGRGRSSKVAAAAAAMALVVGLAPTPLAFGASSRWEWEGVDRIVALGDVHGRYDQLTSILQGTGLVDDQLRWTGEKDHLVLCGDLVDRGPDDRAVMDLARRLQKEADSAGGRVHVVLGNHEVMNLTRDFRYVRPQGYAAFAADERSDERQDAWRAYEKTFSGRGIETAQLQAAFDEDYPPGFFARRRAFSRRGDYGSWLLEQPSVIKVNGIVFVHGGLTPEVAGLGIDQINARVRKSLRAFMDSSRVLERTMRPPASFKELYSAATRVVRQSPGGTVDGALLRAAETLRGQIHELAFVPDGPLWYRGSSLADERIERERLTAVLERLDARAIMAGHTVTGTGRVSSRFDGRFLRGDVGMGLGRQGYAVVFEKQQAMVFDPVTSEVSPPFAEPPHGEGWDGGFVHLADAELELVLSVAEIVTRTEVGRRDQRAELWELKGEGAHLRGVFKDIDEGSPRAGRRPSSRRYAHEVAAYKLDRMLDLGMVPVAVLRTNEGRRGALRAVVETALDLVSIRSRHALEGLGTEEAIRAIAEAYGIGVDELREQVIRFRVFDGLIGNQEREDEDKLFVPAEGHVCLVDHEKAFPLSTDLDPDLLSPCQPVPPDLRNALIMLDMETLRATVGDYLTTGQIEALLKRRDVVLELCPSSMPTRRGGGSAYPLGDKSASRRDPNQQNP